MYRYEVIKEERYNEHIGHYTAYGILALVLEAETWRPVAQCSDVSTERKVVEQLARLCERVGLEPIHLSCVVQDFLEGACLPTD